MTGLNKASSVRPRSPTKANRPIKTVRIQEPNDKGVYPFTFVATKEIPIISVSEESEQNKDVGSGSAEDGFKSDKSSENYQGYLNPAFDDKDDNKEVSASGVDSDKKVFVTKVEVEMVKRSGDGINRKENESNRKSVYENVDEKEIRGTVIVEEPEENEEEEYENDTFHLAKDSSLFSRVSRNTISEMSSPTEAISPIEDLQEHQCKVVEVKAGEIVKSNYTSVEPKEHVIVHHDSRGPQTVEIVEIIEDTETEPEESATDTDQEDKRSPATVRRTD
ncbi:hypothetical protein LSTR_LSTR016957 [Laodelphax striatellus]|uniref:Uncharacterized protein n=1 Tax=Laodelphax striatellus TaxID=195883 RepID=A0A482XAA7_LAOST|nr:hypothetical protein LSTR_LSTR016957 [Laodelphax striatellus]